MIKIKKLIIKLICPFIPVRNWRKRLRTYYKNNCHKELIFKKGVKALIISPHPDDESIGCGGTLMKYGEYFDSLCLASAGFSRPEMTGQEYSKIRTAEYNKAMDFAGIKNRFIVQSPDVVMCHKFYRKAINEYCKLVDLTKYDFIFLPHNKDGHPDHEYTSTVLKLMLKKQRFKSNLDIVFYEVWRVLPEFNATINITDVLDKKKELISNYETQMGRDYIGGITSLNRYRGVTARFDEGYNEGFFVMNVYKFLKLKLKKFTKKDE